MLAENSPAVAAPSNPAATDRAARAARSRREALVDAALVRRFNAGDQAAFVEIVTRYRAKMFHAAHGLLRNRADAEEIAQDTFIRAHRGLVNFRGESSLAAWLYCIALNLARNRYWYFHRRRRHLALPLDAALSDDSNATFADLIACENPGPVREAAVSEFALIVSDCMDRLPAGQRDILQLRNVRQFSYQHISRLLGVNVGTVKSRIARARITLRELMATAYPEYTPETSAFECFEPLRSSGRIEAACA